MMMLWMVAAGCAVFSEPVPSTQGDGFFDRPWPDDRRLTAEGTLDLSDFPNRGEYELLEKFLDVAESLDGFGTNSPIYVHFPKKIRTDRLPTPEASLDPSASVILLDVDPRSPRRGEQIPIQWRWNDDETSWQAENLLAIAPVWGAPLDPRTTYAVVLSTDIASPPDGFQDVWRTDHAEYAYYQPIQETLFQIGRELDTVAYAFAFTTQDPTAELARVVRAIDTWLPRPAIEAQELVEYSTGTTFFRYFEGVVSVPVWQEGSKPYASEGGGFVFDDSGEPTLFGWDQTRFSLTLPTTAPPEDGWPLVIHSHGTGGDYASHARGSTAPMMMLAREGMAGFGISQPLHGDRGEGYNAELYSFNYLNPTSGRTMFRQGALDQVFLSRLLTEQDLTFTTTEGEQITLNGSRVGYLGHSHGGEVGAMAAAWFGDRIRGTLLSGAGGGLSITLIERDAGDFDIEGLITLSLGFDSGEVLDTFHPVIAIVQLDAEVTDPLNYAPYWSQRPAPWGDNPPVSVLQTEGLSDIYSPPRSIEALAGAGGLPVLAPDAQLSEIQLLTGLHDEPTPTRGNLDGWTGTPVSGGIAQYPDDGHFAIFDNTDAIRLYTRFLSTALTDDDDAPEIIDIVDNFER